MIPIYLEWKGDRESAEAVTPLVKLAYQKYWSIGPIGVPIYLVWKGDGGRAEAVTPLVQLAYQKY